MNSYPVSKDPAAVRAVLNSGEEEVNIRSNPAIECVAVFAELFCQRVFDHVGI